MFERRKKRTGGGEAIAHKTTGRGKNSELKSFCIFRSNELNKHLLSFERI